MYRQGSLRTRGIIEDFQEKKVFGGDSGAEEEPIARKARRES